MKTRIQIQQYESPIIAAAIHDGHYIPSIFRNKMHLQEHERMREEDPYTAYMADLPVNTIVVGNSRFIADLNRPRNQCIYESPEKAWGLTVWKYPLTKKEKEYLLAYYDLFYSSVNTLITNIIKKYGYFVMLDIHSYNHKRQDPYTSASSKTNPEINIGTIHNLPKWNTLINAFIDSLSATTINGHKPDVRTNVKFKGGEFSNWVCTHHGHYSCTFSIEFKKTFMNEWTGRANLEHIRGIQQALKHCIPILVAELRKITDTSPPN